MSRDESQERYEHTPRMATEQRSRVVAAAHLATWVGVATVVKVLYSHGYRIKTPSRRRVLQWALDNGYLQRVGAKTEKRAASPSIRELISEAERTLKS